MTTIEIERRNKRIGLWLGGFVAAMVGLGYASAPLYSAFCQATGFDGTTQRKTDADLALAAKSAPVGKIVSVRFDANVSPKMHWLFEPEQWTERVAIGAREMAFFHAKNLTDHPITGRAVFNVSPTQVGKYFNKIQCFCFTEQTLKPGEDVRMPVVYYVDPAFLTDPDVNDISEITLSYTFLPVDSPAVAG